MSDQWTLLTSHGHVLFFLASRPDATMREVAYELGLSERRVAGVIKDLTEARMIRSSRAGVHKHYEINQDANFRHPTLSHIRLSDVLGTFTMQESLAHPTRWRSHIRVDDDLEAGEADEGSPPRLRSRSLAG